MANPVRAIPEGYHSISPALTCKDAARAIDFYKHVFGAEEIMRMPSPDGKISHAELKIGDSIIFVNDEMGPMAAVTPGDAADVFVPLRRECGQDVHASGGCRRAD